MSHQNNAKIAAQLTELVLALQTWLATQKTQKQNDADQEQNDANLETTMPSGGGIKNGGIVLANFLENFLEKTSKIGSAGRTKELSEELKEDLEHFSWALEFRVLSVNAILKQVKQLCFTNTKNMVVKKFYLCY